MSNRVGGICGLSCIYERSIVQQGLNFTLGDYPGEWKICWNIKNRKMKILNQFLFLSELSDFNFQNGIYSYNNIDEELLITYLVLVCTVPFVVCSLNYPTCPL